MTGNHCGYYLVVIGADGEPTFDVDGLPTISGPLVELPVGRWGRLPIKKRSNLTNETELGRTWVFPQFDKRTFSLPYRLFPAELEIFRTLSDAVGGNRDPFLFVPDVDASPTSTIFVRGAQDFDEGTEFPVDFNGAIIRMVDFTWVLTEEPAGTAVTA